MARRSRGASRDWDSSACTPSPAPALNDLGAGFLGIEPYDTGLANTVLCYVLVWHNGELFDTVNVSPSDLLNGTWEYETDGEGTWAIQFQLGGVGLYCAGVTPMSNELNFG